jgi:hypothetical protein
VRLAAGRLAMVRRARTVDRVAKVWLLCACGGAPRRVRLREARGSCRLWTRGLTVSGGLRARALASTGSCAASHSCSVGDAAMSSLPLLPTGSKQRALPRSARGPPRDKQPSPRQEGDQPFPTPYSPNCPGHMLTEGGTSCSIKTRTRMRNNVINTTRATSWAARLCRCSESAVGVEYGVHWAC